jgi:hypothetical protein
MINVSLSGLLFRNPAISWVPLVTVIEILSGYHQIELFLVPTQGLDIQVNRKQLGAGIVDWSLESHMRAKE